MTTTYIHTCARNLKSVLGNEVNCGAFVFHMYKPLSFSD